MGYQHLPVSGIFPLVIISHLWHNGFEVIVAGTAKKLDSKGRLVLGPQFANTTVLVEKVAEGEFHVKTATVIPAREAWLFKNLEAMELVMRGLEDSKNGRVSKVDIKKNASWIDKLKD